MTTIRCGVTFDLVKDKWAGDLCLLAVPRNGVSRAARELQRTLRGRYGGRIEEFLHLTLQRFRRPPELGEEHLRHRFAELASVIEAMRLDAVEAHVMYSAFRRCHIVKATVVHDPGSRAALDRVNKLLKDLGCELRYGRPSNIVTVLTNVERTREGPIALHPPRPLFTAERLVASLITGSHDFRLLWQLDLSSSRPPAGDLPP